MSKTQNENQCSNLSYLPLVSIITRTYRGRLGFLKEAVESILHQTYPQIQLIVVEDGSDTASDYLSTLRFNKKIDIIYRALPKRGRCYAGNQGLALANGELVNFLDDDDIFLPHHIESLVEHLRNHPDCCGAYSVAWTVPTKVISTDPLSYKELDKHVFIREDFSRSRLWDYNYIPIQSVLFKRSLFIMHGGFEESLDCLEDWDLWMRYTLESDFAFLDRVTSIFRMPCDEAVISHRRDQHFKYIPIIRERQKTLINSSSCMPNYKELKKLMPPSKARIFVRNICSQVIRTKKDPIGSFFDFKEQNAKR